MWWKRCDGELVKDVDAERRIMPYLMRGRNESVALFDMAVDVTRTEVFLGDAQRTLPDAGVFHVVLWALARTLEAYPRLNRFVAGGRMYQRDGIWISFAAKQRLEDDAPLVTVKYRCDPTRTFGELVAEVDHEIEVARSPAKSSVDKELDLLLRLPGSLLRAAVALVRVADRWGLLPRGFIEPDPMFASVWVANLGSLGMPPVFHHLYEYGNAGIFCTMGSITEQPLVRDGMVVASRVLPLRVSYDERIDDGMYAGHAARLLQRLVEDPEANGCTLPEAPAGPVRGRSSSDRVHPRASNTPDGAAGRPHQRRAIAPAASRGPRVPRRSR